MKILLNIFFCLFTIFSSYCFASDDWWTERQITIEKNQETHAKKVYGQSARIIRENGFQTTPGASQTARDLVRRSIAVDIPTPTKVGTPMLQRIKHVAKAPGVGMVGTYAVMELIEAIGWVMEDGTYVKKIPEEGEIPNCGANYYYKNNEAFAKYGNSSLVCALPQAKAITQQYFDALKYDAEYSSCSYINNNAIECPWKFKDDKTFSRTFTFNKVTHNNPPPKEKTVPITPALLGAAMLGTGYKDPDPNFNNDTVNTGEDTGVKEIYEHDPSGVGDELANQMDEKLKNAKPTGDGKSSYVGDPKYDNKDLTEGDTSADRSWDNDAGEATGESKPQTDPDTGEETGGQSISFKFPIFCEWASSMCKWYDDWKKSDQVHKDHMTKTEEHQDSEKSFWQTVKDWFDWTKEEPDQHDEDTEVEVNDLEIPDIDTSILKAAGQCPADFSYPFPLPFGGTYTISYSYVTVCYWFSKLYYIVISVAWIVAYKIVTGVGGTKDNG